MARFSSRFAMDLLGPPPRAPAPNDTAPNHNGITHMPEQLFDNDNSPGPLTTQPLTTPKHHPRTAGFTLAATLCRKTCFAHNPKHPVHKNPFCLGVKIETALYPMAFTAPTDQPYPPARLSVKLLVPLSKGNTARSTQPRSTRKSKKWQHNLKRRSSAS